MRSQRVGHYLATEQQQQQKANLPEWSEERCSTSFSRDWVKTGMQEASESFLPTQNLQGRASTDGDALWTQLLGPLCRSMFMGLVKHI